MFDLKGLWAAASANVFSERELKLLASIEINNAVQAIADDRPGTAIRCLADAQAHLRSLIEKRR